MKFKANCMYIDQANANGIYYPKDVIEKVVTQHKEYIDDNKSMGEINDVPNNTKVETSLDRISHRVTDLEIVDDYCVVHCESLDTPLGKLLDTMMNENLSMSINPVLMSTLDDDKCLGADTKILRFDITSTAAYVNENNKIVAEDI